MTSPESPGASKRAWVRPVLRDFLHLFALSGFAFAQPILDLFGNNATFFVAHDVSSTGIVLFTVALLLGPPIGLTTVVAIARLISDEIERYTMATLVGVLVGFTIVPIVDRSADLPTWLYFVALAGVGVGAAYLYLEQARIREFVSWLAFAPFLFAGAFLFASPVNTLVFSSDPNAYADVAKTETPVVLVVLDEFPTASLLDDRGRIDAKRFPGFARLADMSNWYPNAATVSRSTSYAVPAILSGELPEEADVGTAASFPRSLFTLLGQSHEMHVDELVTAVCPENICTGSEALPGTTSGTRALLKDTGIAYLHTLLPVGLEDAWLPPLGERWAGFTEDPTDVKVTKSKKSAPKGTDGGDSVADTSGLRENQGQRFDEFIASLNPQPGRPGLWFLHELLPHIPYSYLPDRLQYSNGVLPVGVDTRTGVWADDAYLGDLARQQFMLQVQFLDEKIGEMLDKLEVTGMLDRSLLIVTADHGVSHQPGFSLRPPDPEQRGADDVMPVPMFVKLPNQQDGAVERKLVQTVDVLPTIADVLGIDLPKEWAPDGRSMLEGKGRDAFLFDKVEDGQTVQVEGPIDVSEATERFRSLLPPSATHDLWRLGPNGSLVGERAGPITGDAATGVTVTPQNADDYANVSKAGPVVPARFVASVAGAPVGTPMAVALNGVVAGVGEVATVDGQPQLIVMVDPALLENGDNQVSMFQIDQNGRELHPVA